jgi:hypothetical protein
MNLELDDNEKAALVELLRDTIGRDRFPLSPRVKRLRGILAKLALAPAAPAAPYPPPEPPGERSMAMAKRRRR